MNEEIKKLLGDSGISEELINQVIEKLGDKKIMIDDDTFIPKARLDQELQKNKDLNGQLDSQKTAFKTQKTEFDTQLNAVNDELKSLSETAKLTEEQKQKITDLATSNENMKADYEKKLTDYDEQIKNQKLNHKIDMKLLEIGAKNIVPVKAMIDMSKVSIDNDNILGLDDQIETLKKDNDYLFGETKKVGTTPPDGDNPPVQTELQGKYDEAVKKHGIASVEALSLKRQMFEKN